MSSRVEDFPTPVSPTRRMVYGVSALFFDVLMIPCLRSSALLEILLELIHRRGRCNLLDSECVTLIIVFQGVLVCASQVMFRSDPPANRDHWSDSAVVQGHGQGRPTAYA